MAPNLAKLAASGMQFNNSYVNQAVCSPTRNSFMSARAPPPAARRLCRPTAADSLPLLPSPFPLTRRDLPRSGRLKLRLSAVRRWG